MHKRIGLVVVAVIILAGVLPLLVNAEPTRTLSAEIVEIKLDGELGPNGEFATGTHEVKYMVNNTGNEYFTEQTRIYLNIFYPNDTLYLESFKDNIIAVNLNSMGEFIFGNVILPEGSWKIVINSTFAGVNTMAELEITVMDVIDLSIESDFFEEEGIYPLDEELMPSCSVEYNGNVLSWADNVTVNLRINNVDSTPVTYYDEDMVIMLHNSTPVDPGHQFSVMFDLGWAPTVSGEYQAAFTISEFDDYDATNNTFNVYFSVEDRPSIEGWVKTGDDTPVQDVKVRAILGSFDTETLTDSMGYYQFMDLAPGTYSIEFTKLWSTSALNESVVVETGETLVVNATVNKMTMGGFRGTVFLPDGTTPAEGATVTITIPGEPILTDVTDTDGEFSFINVKAGQVSIVASLQGYDNDERPTYTIIEQIWNEQNLTLGDVPFTVTFSPPDGELTVSVSPTLTLQFSKPVNKTTVNQTTIYMVKLSTSESVPVTFAFVDEENKVLVEPINLLEYDEDYRVTVTDMLEDEAGNTFPQISYATFTTEVEIIEIDIVSQYPGDDQSEVPTDIAIRATFPEPMDPTTISEQTFQIFISGGGGSPIPGTVVYYSNNYTAMFIPDSNLEYEGRYSVSLSNEIDPIEESHIFRGTTWSFETMALITTGSVVGFVKDKDGNAFSPDKVTITVQKGTNDPITLNVNKEGKFQKLNLDAGIYTITIEIPDHKKHTDQFTIIAGEDTDLKTIELDKKDEDDNMMTIGLIVLVVLVILVILIMLYVFLGRRERPIEAEEEPARARGRPAPFAASSRERESFQDSHLYDEIGEGEFLCPVCGSVVGADEPDCPNCGAEFEDDLFECPECGALIPADAMECPECGARFEEEEPEEGEEYDDEEEDPDMTEEYEVEDMDEEEIPFRDGE
jgi:hypothetical protein